MDAKELQEIKDEYDFLLTEKGPYVGEQAHEWITTLIAESDVAAALHKRVAELEECVRDAILNLYALNEKSLIPDNYKRDNVLVMGKLHGVLSTREALEGKEAQGE